MSTHPSGHGLIHDYGHGLFGSGKSRVQSTKSGK